jgi:hypothetical protein
MTQLRKHLLPGALVLLLALLGAGCATRHAADQSGAGLFTPNRYCRDHTASRHVQALPGAQPTLKQELAEFKVLVEQSATYRQETVRLVDYLKEKAKHDQPLSGADIDQLNLGTAAHLKLRQKLYHLAEAHECWLDAAEAGSPLAGASSEERLTGVMLSLSAALTLYDNYLLAISAVDSDRKLRRYVNKSDSGYQKRALELANISVEFNSISKRQRVRRAMVYVEQELGRLGTGVPSNPELAYLKLYLGESPSYAMVRGYAPFAVLAKKVDFLGTITADTVANLESEGVNLFSMLFGNTTGFVALRHGKLYDRPADAERIKKELRAGDILLEKTPFRLTDRFIPGFWGHAAVWVGTEQELKALGLWDDPVVKPYRKQISEGRLVVEALRTGVTMNSLEHFMNIDDLGVLRQRDLDDAERGAVIIRALRQVGKAYDFNFDVESTNRVVCSGLVYLAYAKIPWDSVRTLGRVTFSPDNVAVKALPGGPLDVVVLFHDGEQVTGNRLDKMCELMGATADQQASGK